MPKPRPNFNPGPAELGLSGGAGKGDCDRSPGWRKNYDDIDWGVIDPFLGDENTVRRGGRLIKRYPR